MEPVFGFNFLWVADEAYGFAIRMKKAGSEQNMSSGLTVCRLGSQVGEINLQIPVNGR